MAFDSLHASLNTRMKVSYPDVSPSMSAVDIVLKHVASQKVAPTPLLEPADHFDMPPEPQTLQLKVVDGRTRFVLKGLFSFPPMVVVDIDISPEGANGRHYVTLSEDLPKRHAEMKDDTFREWWDDTRKRVHDEMIQKTHYDNEYVPTGSTYRLSRATTLWGGKPNAPMRLWKINRKGVFERYKRDVPVGSIVAALCSEIRGFAGRDGIGTCGELSNDLVVIQRVEPPKRRRIQYISDSD